MEELLALLPGPVVPHDVVLTAAIGQVSARTLIAPGPLPIRPYATTDGWAVTAADTQGAGPYSPAVLPNGVTLLRIGETLPSGADAILLDWALLREPSPGAIEPVAPGEGVRLCGGDVAAGALLCREGERLRATSLPALLSFGFETVSVRRPRVALIRCGDARAEAPMHDKLARFLAALLEDSGASPISRAPMPASLLPAALAHAAAGADLVVLLGDERCAGSLAEAGRIVVHGLGARPGASVGFGVVADVPVVLPSERWDDAYAAWLMLIRPAVRLLSGAAVPDPLRARLTRKLVSLVGVLDIALVRRVGPGLVEPLTVGEVTPGALAAADAVLMIAPSSEGFDAGTEVDLQPL